MVHQQLFRKQQERFHSHRDTAARTTTAAVATHAAVSGTAGVSPSSSDESGLESPQADLNTVTATVTALPLLLLSSRTRLGQQARHQKQPTGILVQFDAPSVDTTQANEALLVELLMLSRSLAALSEEKHSVQLQLHKVEAQQAELQAAVQILKEL